MILTEEAYLEHYGILRKSGRYPWGSGGTKVARSKTFLDMVNDLKGQGMSDTEICKAFSTPEHPFNTSNLRAMRSIAKNEIKADDIRTATRLADSGMSNIAIGREMGRNESSVRALLNPSQKDRNDVLKATTDMLRRQVEEKGYLDIGAGAELELGISADKLKTAVAALQEEGYGKHRVDIQQLATGKDTTVKVLVKPGVTQKDVWMNKDKIRQITEHTEDGGRSYLGLKPPLDISSDRIDVVYGAEGAKADGVMYVRPGVKDVSIGAASYAQVRVSVDGTHYLKGMAVYKSDLPDGVDIQFNTNKKQTDNKLDALKPQKEDEDNPFGATVRQIIDPDGNLTSAMNIVGHRNKEGSGEEGSWEKWNKSLASQVLSKQSPQLIRGQLNMTYERKQNELDAIMKLTNPAVKKRLLESYADDTDSAAVHLKAAPLPGQATHVIMPVNSMKKTEIYAPNYNNGDRVALVRYPHAGTFEIPELTVNNNHKPAQALLGVQARDAVGIHHSVAERLSGADFDGDTVLVIPNNKGQIKSSPALAGLKNFDPQREYKVEMTRGPDGKINDRRYIGNNKQKEMGDVTNLISDMTIRGASGEKIARAVRHSMVVIDAEKHELDYKASARNNAIAALKKEYQPNDRGDGRGGASTLITRATSDVYGPARRARYANEGGPIDPATGRKVYTPTGETYVNRKGETVPKQFKSARLAEETDAHALSSGTVVEKIYADHSNRLKSLANKARKSTLTVPNMQRSPSAAKVYAEEVSSLTAKLNTALKNAPYERQAQIVAGAIVKMKRQAKPDMDNDELRKIKNQALAEARTRVGAGKKRIEITDREWNAIQAGAISHTQLNKILTNADLDVVKQLATPRAAKLMTPAKTARAEAMLANGYTQAQVAAQLGVSLTTLKTNID